jgi:hypothetical protein
LKRLMKITPPKMGELMVMMMMVSPSGREVPPAKSARRRAQLLLPKFRIETAALRPEIALPIFSREMTKIYHKEEARGGLGCPPPRGARPGGW